MKSALSTAGIIPSGGVGIRVNLTMILIGILYRGYISEYHRRERNWKTMSCSVITVDR